MMRRFYSILCGLLSLTSITFAQHKQKPIHRLFLLGDAGKLDNGRLPVVDAVMKKLNPADSNDRIMYLGDNIYPAGMPAEGHKDHEESIRILQAQIAPGKNSKNQLYWIPGNHDWGQGSPDGIDRIKAQGAYIDSMGMANLHFLPEQGCPGPIEIPLQGGLTLVILDTQWWLHPYAKAAISAGCDCNTTDDIELALRDIILRNKNRNIVVMGHHPMYTNGVHGGYYTIKQHIFPLTELNDDLYIPLPVIGSIYPLTRGVFGDIQDVKHPVYKQMIKQLTGTFREDSRLVYASGHDHNMELLKKDNNFYVISGSASKHLRVRKDGKNSLFAAERRGYSIINSYADGTMDIEFHAVDGADQDSVLFSQQLLNTFPVIDTQKEITSLPADYPKQVVAAADTSYEKAGHFHRILLGEGYRKDWAMPLTFPVMRFKTDSLTYTIVKKGGGNQTLSLRLMDQHNRQWTLRTMKKYPAKAIPVDLRETIAKELVQDQISAANPYGPLTVPVLAKAANVPHANPRIVYIPNDPELGVYKRDFADNLAFLEEYIPDTVKKTYNTLKVQDAVEDDSDIRVDQERLLHARMLDIFMGDWDRHEDQWRWGVLKNGKKKTYYPIPRDRDQVYFINQGIIPGFAAKSWIMPLSQGFAKTIPDIRTQYSDARFFDRYFLNELDEDAWKKSAQLLVDQMTDDVIERAMKAFPAPIYKLSGYKVEETLKARRAIMVSEAIKFYRFLAEAVDIRGTNGKDLFRLRVQDNGLLAVDVLKIKKKNEPELYYHRVFDPKVTKEIRLYGLDGADQFVVEGNAHLPLKVRIIGGKGKDRFIDSTTVGRQPKLFVYDQSTQKNEFALKPGTHVTLKANPEINKNDREGFKYDVTIPFFNAGYSYDDGLSLGYMLKITKNGFREMPKNVHSLSARHAIVTNAFDFKYEGEFNHLLGSADLLLNTDVRMPQNAVNFFGIGNNSGYDHRERSDVRFNIARYYSASQEVLVRHRWKGQTLTYGPGFNYFKISTKDNQDRYVGLTDINGLDPSTLYKDKFYGTFKVSHLIDTRNSILTPSRGISWLNSANFAGSLNNAGQTNLRLSTDLRIYSSFDPSGRVVIVNRFGAGHVFGNYEFFQGMSLGNATNLRGFRNNRFIGKSMAYHNIEVRVKLFDFQTYLFPGAAGLIMFNDVGRVWQPGEDSKVWHDGYGGGIFISPINKFVFTGILGHSKEGYQPSFSMGFRF